MIRPKNETGDLLLSITKNCETTIKPTHTEPQELLEFKLSIPRESFSFIPLISIEGCCMVGLTNLEVCNSFFQITEENSKLDLYRDSFDEFSFSEIKHEIEDYPNITPELLEDEELGPHTIETYRKISMEKRYSDG